ncbi:unnamed protein product [Blepharisma stoltei]|uniref:Uncharacterized protein n=1 Tax=Blepharisma stoltei TaxID=1481888 RepID=A0AAU9K4S2_9CILI|nr:unnamed protein product [Blepharisma stoltei]
MAFNYQSKFTKIKNLENANLHQFPAKSGTYTTSSTYQSSKQQQVSQDNNERFIRRYNMLMNRFAQKTNEKINENHLDLQNCDLPNEKIKDQNFEFTSDTTHGLESTVLPHFGDISSIQVEESQLESTNHELFFNAGDAESYLQPWHLVEQAGSVPQKRDLDEFVKNSMKYGEKVTKILAGSGVVSPAKLKSSPPSFPIKTERTSKLRPISEGHIDFMKYRSQTARAAAKHKSEVPMSPVKHITVRLSPSISSLELLQQIKSKSYKNLLANKKR